MISIHTGPTLLSMAHVARRDDLELAAEHRRGLWLAQRNHAVPRHHHRPWWWGLARSRAT